MPPLKDLLVAQTSIPKSFEAQATMLPKLSEGLANIAKMLPTGPDLPISAPSQGSARLPKIAEVFKGPGAAVTEIQSSLKDTLGGLGQAGSENKRGETTEKKAPAGAIATRGSL